MTSKESRTVLRGTGFCEESCLLDQSLWKDFFIEVLIVASLFHDLGYPWQRFGKDQNIINTFTNPIFQNNGESYFFRCLETYPYFLYALNRHEPRLKCIVNPSNLFYRLECWDGRCPFSDKNDENRMKRICGILGSAYNKTHGLPGALNFLYLNDGFKKQHKEYPIRRLAIEWAASSILMHDMKGIYWGSKKNGKPELPFLQINAEHDPVSALLTLADVLQEFERPCAEFQQEENKTIKLKYDPACSKVPYVSE